MNLNLTGKTAIITGSSKGIGKAIALGLAKEGANVVISSRKQDAVDAVVEEFSAQGLSALGVACHVGKMDQAKNLINRTIEHFSSVDILINNAATNPFWGPINEVSEELFAKILHTNVIACHNLSNLCYPHMKNQGGGSIINISSVEGQKPSFGLGAYSVSKAALIMLTKNQAKEWGPDGIRSNTICPGLIQTKFSQAIWGNEKVLDELVSHLPLKRMAQPEEMVGLALMLASDAGSFTTGGVFASDGGHLLI